jgi:uncharacterized protein (TIGR03435 family)
MRTSTVLVGIVATAAILVAQGRVAFDAASVKPNASLSPAMNNRFSPGRMTLINHSPDVLIQQAYGVTFDRLVNLPEWARRVRFDIAAVYTPPNAPYAERMRMLQTLLTERFALRVHPETREMSVYALVTVRPDGPFGPGLRPSSRDCSPRKDASGKPILNAECSFRITPDSIRGNVEWVALNLPVQLGIRDRPVIDRTGLNGRFDIDLEWLPESRTGEPGERVSIFTALPEQLGLRLEPTKAPLEMLVVDSISRPAPD